MSNLSTIDELLSQNASYQQNTSCIAFGQRGLHLNDRSTVLGKVPELDEIIHSIQKAKRQIYKLGLFKSSKAAIKGQDLQDCLLKDFPDLTPREINNIMQDLLEQGEIMQI